MQDDTDTGNAKVWLAWAFVGIPLVWGIIMTVSNALALFQ